MNNISDEPRTSAERGADFAIGMIVGSMMVGLVFLDLSELFALWSLLLVPIVIGSCGYLNYKFGAALWSCR